MLILHQQIAILSPLLARGNATYLLLHCHVEEHLLLLIEFVFLCICSILCFVELCEMALGHGIDRVGCGVQVTCRRVQSPVIVLEVFALAALDSLGSWISRSLRCTCWHSDALMHTLAGTALNPTLHLL